jgi:hypothetical protein
MDWKQLMHISHGEPLLVERIRLPSSGVAIEGSFELPPLARLSEEDQVFIAAFVKSHGSIKEMERLFGVSYPTIKSRLHRLSASLDPELKVDSEPGEPEQAPVRGDRAAILDQLERGEISPQRAAEALRR